MKNNSERILAYNHAVHISEEELTNVSGGSSNGTTLYTTKQTADTSGNYDTGVDVQWD